MRHLSVKHLNYFLLFIILWSAVSCQPTSLNASVKGDDVPTDAPTAPLAAPPTAPVLIIQPTQTPRSIVPPTTLSDTNRTHTPVSSPSPESSDPRASIDLVSTHTPAPNPTPEDTLIEIGRSAGDRPITAQRIGTGERILLLVGGIHGGYEANTVTLMHQLIDHFTENPGEMPRQTALVIIPVANPDGMAYGSILRGRFNDDGVDLNRNWACEWSADAFWRDERVNAGIAPMSEPETRALAALIQTENPAAALFYHSAAGGIFAGNCGEDHGSAAMSKVLGEATGYSYGATFSAYSVTGTASTWADGQGIPSADVELLTHEDSEFDRNLRGVIAVLDWLAARP